MSNDYNYLYKIQVARPEMLLDDGTEFEQEHAIAHFHRVKDLAAQGVVLLAGRTQTTEHSSFGIVIFRADTNEEAREIVNADPVVISRVMRAELYPYGPPPYKFENIDGQNQYLWTVQPVRPTMLTDGFTEDEEKHAVAHGEYLQQLLEDGTSILYGRTKNTDYSSFGVTIFQADSDDAARAIVNNDPAVKNRIFRAELYPYRIAVVGS